MEILWYFVIYSIIGWIAEVVYQAVHRGEIINRGFLNGPVCPIYGFGAIFIFSAYDFIEGMLQCDSNIYIDFAIGVFLATVLELFAGWALHRLFHARWWDYSDRKLQFHGYICLEFSLIWGFAATFVRELVQQGIERMVSHFPHGILGVILLSVIYIIYLTDTVITVITVNNLNKRLHEIDVLSKQLDNMEGLGKDLRKMSDSMSEQIGSNTLRGAQRFNESQVQAALAKAELHDTIEEKRLESEKKLNAARKRFDENIKEGYKRYEDSREEYRERIKELQDKLMSGKWFGTYRLFKAFPTMKHENYSDVINNLKERLKYVSDEGD